MNNTEQAFADIFAITGKMKEKVDEFKGNIDKDIIKLGVLSTMFDKPKEEAPKFQVEDIVEVTESVDSKLYNYSGLVGKIVDTGAKEQKAGVQFDHPVCGGHTCSLDGKDKHCRYFLQNDLILKYRDPK